MFERFTDRARKVLALAKQEAQRFNHEYIETEHLLLGLAKEGCGVGAHVLKLYDVDLCKLRREVEKLVNYSYFGNLIVGYLVVDPAVKTSALHRSARAKARGSLRTLRSDTA